MGSGAKWRELTVSGVFQRSRLPVDADQYQPLMKKQGIDT
jgi:hypothetical protein